MRDQIVYLLMYAVNVMPPPSDFPKTNEFDYPSLYQAFIFLKNGVQLLLPSNFSKVCVDKAQFFFERVFRTIQLLDEDHIHMNWHNSLHLCDITRYVHTIINIYAYYTYSIHILDYLFIT